jgi:hypothetical protein
VLLVAHTEPRFHIVILVDFQSFSCSFVTCCVAELEEGELIHDARYSLYESMTIIELMDPKMDMGMAGARNLSAVACFGEAMVVSFSGGRVQQGDDMMMMRRTRKHQSKNTSLHLHLHLHLPCSLGRF